MTRPPVTSECHSNAFYREKVYPLKLYELTSLISEEGFVYFLLLQNVFLCSYTVQVERWLFSYIFEVLSNHRHFIQFYLFKSQD